MLYLCLSLFRAFAVAVNVIVVCCCVLSLFIVVLCSSWCCGVFALWCVVVVCFVGIHVCCGLVCCSC